MSPNLANRLTARAALKFAAMCDAAEAAHERVLASQRRVSGIEDQRRHLSTDDQETFDALTVEIERLSQRRDSDNCAFLHQMRMVTAIKTWLQQVPSSFEFRDVAQHKNLQFRSTEDSDEALDQCREDIARLQNERAMVARAVPPIEDLRAAAAAYVETLVARGRPKVTVDGGKLIVRHGDGKAFGPSREDVALAAWLHPEVMLEKLYQQIAEVHEAEVQRKLPVMSTTARDIRIAQLDGDILRLEHEEEFMIEAAEQCGFHFDRRENADPRAVLGVSIQKRERAVA